MKKLTLMSLIICLIFSVLCLGTSIILMIQSQMSPYYFISTAGDYQIVDNGDSYTFSATFLNTTNKEITFKAYFSYLGNDPNEILYLEREITVPKAESGKCGKLFFHEDVYTLEDDDTVFVSNNSIEYGASGQNNFIMTQENSMIINNSAFLIIQSASMIISIIFVIILTISLTIYIIFIKKQKENKFENKLQKQTNLK